MENVENLPSLRKANADQISVFTQLLASGKITSDELQQIIIDHKDKPSLKRRRRAAEEAARQELASLDNLIEKLAVVLGDKMTARHLVGDLPFTDFKLKSAPNIRSMRGMESAIAQRVRSSVFWMFPGPGQIRFVTPATLTPRDLPESLAKSLLINFLHASPVGNEAVLHELVSKCLVARYTASKKLAPIMAAKSVASIAFARGMRRTLAEKFIPISQLWDEGIFPLGFDSDRRFVVLVGD